MSTIAVIVPEEHQALGERMINDLQDAGYTTATTVGDQPGDMLVVALAPQGLWAVEPALIQALDRHQHVIVVLAQPIDLPRLIDNLRPLDFSGGYDPAPLIAEVERLSAPDAPPPMTVLTPSKREANRRAGLVLVIPIMMMFFAAIVGIALGITVAPEDEFASVETQIFLTRNYFIDGLLPQSTEQAANFQVTAEEYFNETVQPFLVLTATGIAGNSESTHYPRSTEEAAEFEATAARVSTLVQDRMRATVTQLAVTAAAITPTPTPEVVDTPEATPDS